MFLITYFALLFITFALLNKIKYLFQNYEDYKAEKVANESNFYRDFAASTIFDSCALLVKRIFKRK